MVNSHHEEQLFEKAMSGVTRLQPINRVLPSVKKPKPKLTHQPSLNQEEHFSICEQYASVLHEDKLFFQRNRLPERQLRSFKRGKMAIESVLDLHGSTQAEAEQLLIQFLKAATAKHYRHVLVIHGKGHSNYTSNYPILKNKVNEWLRSHSSVLAFCSAQQKDGGTGAVYVLIKQQPGEPHESY